MGAAELDINNKNGLVQDLQTEDELEDDPSNLDTEGIPEERKVFLHPGELNAYDCSNDSICLCR
jgi:hypothetical protein